jgi:hypothetical protein
MFKRAGKLGQENEPAMQAQIPPVGHLPVVKSSCRITPGR